MSSSFANIRAALGLAALLGGLGLSGTANAQQSSFPACPSDQKVRFHNCFGTFNFSNGEIYVGEWVDDKHDGFGTYSWPDGRKYFGEYRADKQHGKGTQTWPDGRKYVGEFRDGMLSGQGTYTWPDGQKYFGEYRGSVKNGQGTHTWPDGEKYVGDFRDGKLSGHGIYTWPDGQKYVGEYRDDKKNGQGTFTWPDGQKYVGEYRDDRKNGQGTHTWPNGQKYVGEFKNGQRNGQGIMYAANGSVLQMGIWANEKFVQSASVTLPAARPSPPVATAPAPSPPVVTAPPPTSPPTSGPKTSSGTAFRIANGQFITNHHVINGCNSLTVDGKLGGRLLASDQTRDLALVSISNDSGPIASIRTTRIQLNESITAAGFPLEGAFSGIAITNGTISRLSGLRGDTGEVQISAPVQPGNSGGPLLDTAGNVIGVVSSKLNALKVAGVSGDIPQNVNFAIAGNALRGFLDAKNINYKEVGNETELTGVQIAARASAFTVLIECQR